MADVHRTSFAVLRERKRCELPPLVEAEYRLALANARLAVLMAKVYAIHADILLMRK